MGSATDTGNRTLWVVFVVMTVATVVFSGLAWNVPTSKRLYHILTTFIVSFAALSYFAMASGHGIGWHHTKEEQHHKHVPSTEHDIYRQVYWARYVDWTVTTPLLLLDLALLAGLPGANILIAIVADIIMVLTGLFASFGSEQTAQKWGWYAIACIAYLVVIWQLVAHGSRNMNVDQEIIAYAVLDILAKPVFGAWLLFTHQSIPETNVDLGGFWSEGLGQQGAIRVGDDDEGA